MIRKLDTGVFVTTRDDDGKVPPPNALRPVDYQAEARAAENKQATFRKH